MTLATVPPRAIPSASPRTATELEASVDSSRLKHRLTTPFCDVTALCNATISWPEEVENTVSTQIVCALKWHMLILIEKISYVTVFRDVN